MSAPPAHVHFPVAVAAAVLAVALPVVALEAAPLDLGGSLARPDAATTEVVRAPVAPRRGERPRVRPLRRPRFTAAAAGDGPAARANRRAAPRLAVVPASPALRRVVSNSAVAAPDRPAEAAPPAGPPPAQQAPSQPEPPAPVAAPPAGNSQPATQRPAASPPAVSPPPVGSPASPPAALPLPPAHSPHVASPVPHSLPPARATDVPAAAPPAHGSENPPGASLGEDRGSPAKHANAGDKPPPVGVAGGHRP